MDLWPLLFRRKLHIDELAGSDVKAHLQVKADGSNNWTFHRPAPAPGQSAGARRLACDERGPGFRTAGHPARRAAEPEVKYSGPDGRDHFFSLLALAAQSPANQPFQLTLNGNVEKEFPYKLEFTGGKLADLAGDKPWPIAFTLTFLSSTLTASGSVSGRSGEVSFGLGTENLIEFERLLQTDLPDVGASGIAGTVVFAPNHVAIPQLTGAMGNTTLVGALDFDNTGSKPKLSGSLVLPTLDLRPFLGEKSAGKEGATENSEPPRSLAEVYRTLSTATFDLKQLNKADADITLGVGRWLSLPGDVRDVTLQIKLKDGTLQAPVKASIAGVVLAGSADVDSNSTPPKFKLALGTRDSDLGGLAEFLLACAGSTDALAALTSNLRHREIRAMNWCAAWTCGSMSTAGVSVTATSKAAVRWNSASTSSP